MSILDIFKQRGERDGRAEWQAQHDAKMKAWQERIQALYEVSRESMPTLAEKLEPGSPEDLFLTLAGHAVCGGNKGFWPQDYGYNADQGREYVCYTVRQLGLEDIVSSRSSVTVSVFLEEVRPGVSQIKGYAVDITSPDSGELRYQLLLAKKKLVLTVSDAVDKKLSGDKFGIAHIFLSECCSRIAAIELGNYHPSYTAEPDWSGPTLVGHEPAVY